ncbi:Uncharacterised protein [Mycobacteroides abscessus subsp. abscessus]|nr:Uncharacterised protein [Mycobacteroides abscessus subsp. abscessus]
MSEFDPAMDSYRSAVGHRLRDALRLFQRKLGFSLTPLINALSALVIVDVSRLDIECGDHDQWLAPGHRFMRGPPDSGIRGARSIHTHNDSRLGEA